LIELPARISGKVTAAFSNGDVREKEVFGDLPAAEPGEWEFIV
jgi:hypothetical protein